MILLSEQEKSWYRERQSNTLRSAEVEEVMQITKWRIFQSDADSKLRLRDDEGTVANHSHQVRVFEQRELLGFTERIVSGTLRLPCRELDGHDLFGNYVLHLIHSTKGTFAQDRPFIIWATPREPKIGNMDYVNEFNQKEDRLKHTSRSDH